MFNSKVIYNQNKHLISVSMVVTEQAYYCHAWHQSSASNAIDDRLHAAAIVT